MLRSYQLKSRLACLCYALILLGSLVLAIQMAVLFHTDDTEGLGGAVIRIAAALLGIVGGIFAALSLIPLSLRLLSLKKQSRVLVAIWELWSCSTRSSADTMSLPPMRSVSSL